MKIVVLLRMEFRKELLLDLPTELESKRLILRRYDFGQGKDLLELLDRNNNRSFLKEHVDEATYIQTLDEAEIRIRELRGYWESRIRFVLGIWLKSENRYIGNIWIEPKNWKVPSFELGYFIDNGYSGQGLATEAAKRAVIFIFSELNAHKIIILTHDTNKSSIRLADRLGFIKEGHIRDNSINMGQRIGLLLFSLLKSDFEKSVDYTKYITNEL